jgi:hypothetical protein
MEYIGTVPASFLQRQVKSEEIFPSRHYFVLLYANMNIVSGLTYIYYIYRQALFLP